MGGVVGTGVGASVGAIVGIGVGVGVGGGVGVGVGVGVGAGVGAGVGVGVGDVVAVGACVGTGVSVGAGVGSGVGVSAGLGLVGRDVGSDVAVGRSESDESSGSSSDPQANTRDKSRMRESPHTTGNIEKREVLYCVGHSLNSVNRHRRGANDADARNNRATNGSYHGWRARVMRCTAGDRAIAS